MYNNLIKHIGRKIEITVRNPPGCEVCREFGDDGIHACPKCGRNVFDFRCRRHLRKMEDKYGTDDLLELSRGKLSFSQIITIYSFIERCQHHCGDTTFANLEKRMDEIAKGVM